MFKTYVGHNYYNLLSNTTYPQNDYNYNAMVKMGNIKDNIKNESYFKGPLNVGNLHNIQRIINGTSGSLHDHTQSYINNSDKPINSNLEYINFSNSYLENIKFTNSFLLRKVNFTNSHFNTMEFNPSQLDYQTNYHDYSNDLKENYFDNVTSENITGNYDANRIKQIDDYLVGSGMNLSGKDSSSEDLSNVDLRSANLRHVNLNSATISNINLTNSNLAFCKTKISNSDFTPTSRKDTNIEMPKFTGSNYLEIPYTPSLNTKQFSVAVWVNITESSNYQRIFDSFYLAGSTRYGFHVMQYGTNNKFTFRLENGTTGTEELYTSSNSFVVYEWHHYVFQYDGTKQIIYEDGVKTAENTRTLALNTQQKFTIGARYSNDYGFNGYLYDFRYFNRAITEEEIQNIYNYKLIGDEVLHMPTLGNYKYFLQNSTGSGNVIMVKNNNVDFKYILSQGQISNSYDNKKYPNFTGSNSLEIPYTPSLNTSSFTVSVWVYSTSNSTDYEQVWNNRGNTTGSNLYIHSSSKRWSFWIGNGSNWRRIDGPVRTLNTWEHIICVNDNSHSTKKQRLYVNGVEKVSGNHSMAVKTNSNMIIGKHSSDSQNESYKFNGYLYDLRYYDRAITQSEINTIYDSGNKSNKTLGDEVLHILNGDKPENLEEEVYVKNTNVEYNNNYSGTIKHYGESIKTNGINLDKGQVIRNNSLLAPGVDLSSITISSNIEGIDTIQLYNSKLTGAISCVQFNNINLTSADLSGVTIGSTGTKLQSKNIIPTNSHVDNNIKHYYNKIKSYVKLPSNYIIYNGHIFGPINSWNSRTTHNSYNSVTYTFTSTTSTLSGTFTNLLKEHKDSNDDIVFNKPEGIEAVTINISNGILDLTDSQIENNIEFILDNNITFDLT